MGAAISSVQLLFRPFSLFQNGHFLAGVIFSEQPLFRSDNSTEQRLLENRKFFMAVTFRKLFFSEEMFRIKISKKGLLFKADTSAQHQTFQKSYILEKPDFSENQFPHYLLFLESCLFRATTFSKDATFYSSYLFRRATFLQHTFWEELLFHSFGSFPQSHFLFIR